jgi:vacuolar-type H+-ATPase subunit C/Vma6
MEDLRRDRREMTSDLDQKIKVITAHIDLKNMELKNLRFLARAILHQKAEVDSFF